MEALEFCCGVGGGDARRDMFETAVVAHEPIVGFDDELEFGVGVVREIVGG